MNNDTYLDSARRALHFLQYNMWRDKRFLATSRQGKAQLNAYLDDYANMLFAILEYLQCRWDNHLLDWAVDIADALLANFEDREHGGFYFTSHDHEQLIQRNKTFSDDAMPAGNGMACLVLHRLGLLLGNTAYLTASERGLRAATAPINQHAILHCSMLNALEEYLNPPVIIILRGDIQTISNWQKTINHHYLPRTLCFAIASDVVLNNPLADKITMRDTCAYICEGTRCLTPVTSINDVIAYLQTNNPHLHQS